MDCIFCNFSSSDEVVIQNDLAYAMYDHFPVNKGHLLVIPKRHFASYFEASEEELLAIQDLIRLAKDMLNVEMKPDGYNIGINIGEAAGQTIFHLHVHLIPRFFGDVKNPKGGIRHLKKAAVEYDG